MAHDQRELLKIIILAVCSGLKCQINRLEKILSTPTDPIQVAGQNAIANMQAALAQIATIASGVLALDALITQLQNTPGAISPEDQAILDQMQSTSADVVAALGAVNVAPPSTTPPGTPGTGPVPPAPTQASVKGTQPVAGAPKS